MSDQIGTLIQKAKDRKFRDLARLLTLLERGGAAGLSHPMLLRPPRTALRVGVTGPPGAGKSTLVGKLIQSWRRTGASVGVIAVDPSSPFTGGAILGDRVRYAEHFNDPRVFIRSLGSRGSLGGLSAAAYLMLRAMDLWAFDVILIETVGVGQTEFDILHVADVIVLVLVPESGDSIQAMKAGLMEIADIFVVNKADRPGADSLAREIQFYFSEDEKIKTQGLARLFKTVAKEGKGTEELAEGIKKWGQQVAYHNHRLDPQRLRHEALAYLRANQERALQESLQLIKRPEDLPIILGNQVS